MSWGETHQTVFMITHDVDEAIYLADRILLMTNGPYAQVAESVEIPIDRPRSRAEIVEDPRYYPIRNHLVQFLARRANAHGGRPTPKAPGGPRPVRFAADGAPVADAPPPGETEAPADSPRTLYAV